KRPGRDARALFQSQLRPRSMDFRENRAKSPLNCGRQNFTSFDGTNRVSDFTEPLGTRRARRAGNLKSIGCGVGTLRTEQCRDPFDEAVQFRGALEDSRRCLVRARESHVTEPARVSAPRQPIALTT